MQKLISALTQILKDNRIHSFPERKRKFATDALNSNEVMHLSEHIVKIILWPNSQWKKGWLIEIRASLDNLAFGLSRYSKRVGTVRSIEKLWYGAKDLMRQTNDIHADAYWNVIEDMKGHVDSIEDDPFNRYQDLYDIGYDIKEEKDKQKGLTFFLYFKGKKLI